MNYVVPLVLGSVTLGLCISSTAAVLFMLGVAAFTVFLDPRISRKVAKPPRPGKGSAGS